MQKSRQHLTHRLPCDTILTEGETLHGCLRFREIVTKCRPVELQSTRRRFSLLLLHAEVYGQHNGRNGQNRKKQFHVCHCTSPRFLCKTRKARKPPCKHSACTYHTCMIAHMADWYKPFYRKRQTALDAPSACDTLFAEAFQNALL